MPSKQIVDETVTGGLVGRATVAGTTVGTVVPKRYALTVELELEAEG